MRIAVVHNRYIHAGGEDVCVQNEIEALAQAGHSVRSFLIQSDHSLTNMAQAITAPFRNAYIDQIESALQEEKPDLLHIHNLFPLLSPRLVGYAHANAIPTVVTLHNYRPLCLNGLFLTPSHDICERCAKGNYWHGIVRGCYRGSRAQSAFMAAHLRTSKRNGWYDRVTQFIAPSAFLRDKFVSHGFSTDKITIQGHFLPTPSTTPVVAPDPYFLYLGRLSEEKGVRWLLRWMQTHDMPIGLHIAGDGPLKKEVLAAQGGKIRYLGRVSGEAKAAEIARAAALILPSECYENFPLAIMEANQSGVPVLAPAIGGFTELISDGLNGFLYPPKDGSAALAALQRILSAPGLSLRVSSQRNARDRFSKNQFLDERMRLYQSVLAKRV